MRKFFVFVLILLLSHLTYACFDKNDFGVHKAYFKSYIGKSKITESQITKSYVDLTKDCQYKHSDFKSLFTKLTSIQMLSPEFAFAFTDKILSSKNVNTNNVNIILSQKFPNNFLKIRADVSITIIQILSRIDNKQHEYEIFFKDFDEIANDCASTIPEYTQSCRNLTAKYFVRSLAINKAGTSLRDQYLKIKKYVFENIKTKSKFKLESFGYIFTILNTGVVGSDSFIEVYNSLKTDTTVSDKQKFEMSINTANNTFKNTNKTN